MSDKPHPRRKVAALALFALVAFLALSLLTYHRDDPPGSIVYPLAETTQNVCGRSGAITALFMLNGLGATALYVVISLGVLDYRLFRGKLKGEVVAGTLGWALSLAGLATLASLTLGPVWPGPTIGAGGYLGAALRGLLEMHFAAAGTWLIAISATIAGWLICADDVFGVVLPALARSPAKLGHYSRGLGQMFKRAELASLGRKRSDLDNFLLPENAAEAGDDNLRIKKRGGEPLPVDVPGTSATAAPPAQGEEPADSAAAEAPEASLASKLAGALRIKPLRRPDEYLQVRAAIEAARDHEGAGDYELPKLDLLMAAEPYSMGDHEKEVRQKAKTLETTFGNFGLNVKVVEIETGPVIAQYEVELEAGLRLSKITGLSEDLAIALRVPSVRIVAPIPGKNTVGIEVPNAERQIVRLREVIEEDRGKAGKMRIPMFLGKDVAGNPMSVDLTTLPHLLIAGRTGTGKSVCLNTLIMSILMTRRPDEVKLLLIDPKMVELTPYARLPHLMHPVVTDMKKAEAILAWAVEKMEERYALLARAGVRHISVYNQLGEEEIMDRLQPESDEERDAIPTHLPFIVIVADEMADLMMTAPKEVEHHIIRLAQKSRAVGIHLVLATQKPTVDVITGLIKSNLPARISFQVASRTDSRVVLDEMGADKLLGNGDLLFLWPGTSTLLRGQGAYVSDDEINRVVASVGNYEPQFVQELVQLKVNRDAPGEASSGGGSGNRDDLYAQAVELVIGEGRGSVSLLQRSLGIGYGRAARLIDYMAEDGIVGQYNGSQAREVLLTLTQWQERNGGGEDPPPDAPKPRPRNKITPHREDGGGPPAPASGPERGRKERTSRVGERAEFDENGQELDVPFEPDDGDDDIASIEDHEPRRARRA